MAMTLEQMAAVAVKRGRKAVLDGKMVDALKGLKPGMGDNFSKVFGKVSDTVSKSQIREQVRKHFAAAFPGETPVVRFTPTGEPLVGRQPAED